MAYNPGIEQDDDQQQQGQEGQEQGGTAQLSGGSGIITGQSAGDAAKQKKGSGFVNIGQYLGANQGDLAGQTDKVVNKVNEKYDTASNSFRSAADSFNANADQNRVGVGDMNTTDDDKGFIGSWLRDPSNDLGEDDQNQFASWKGAEYAGPQAIQETYRPDINNANQFSETLSNSNGYFPAMEETFGQGRSDYGAGQQRLDASLLSSDKQGRGRIDSTSASRRQNFDSEASSANAAAQQKAGQYMGEADSVRNAALASIGEYVPEYATGLVNQTAQTNAQRRAEYEAARQGGGDQTSFSFANPNQAANVADYYDFDLLYAGGYRPSESLSASYINPNRADFTTYGGDVGMGAMDPTSLARLEALYSMSGDPAVRAQIEADAANTLGFDDVMRGGGTPSFTFNETGYNQAAEQARTAAQQQAVIAENARMDADLDAQQKAIDEIYRDIKATSNGAIIQEGDPTSFVIPKSNKPTYRAGQIA